MTTKPPAPMKVLDALLASLMPRGNETMAVLSEGQRHSLKRAAAARDGDESETKESDE